MSGRAHKMKSHNNHNVNHNLKQQQQSWSPIYHHCTLTIVNLKGTDKVWSFKVKLMVPIKHIQSVEAVDPKIFHHARLVKVAGAGVGHYKVGTFRNELVFYDVQHSGAGIMENSLL
jgi:hypothetical protein